MAVDLKKAEEYGKKILEQFQKDPSKLGPHETRLAKKYYGAVGEADNADQKINQINDQIYQAQARVRSLELQQKENMGKAAAFLEYILALKFDTDEDVPKKAAEDTSKKGVEKKASSKGNGAQDPLKSKGPKRGKRSKKAVKRPQPKA